MNLNFKILIVFFYVVINTSITSCQNTNHTFTWPNTKAAKVTQDFVVAYNSCSIEGMKQFVLKHYVYKESNEKEVNESIEEWMDLFYRYGPIKPHSITINDEYNIEVWMECVVTKNWFAPEFILNELTGKINAVGLLQGEQPKGEISRARHEDEMLQLTEQYLNINTEANLFQGAVLIQKDQEILFAKAYGQSNKKQDVSNTLDTRMRISSITKPITVIACLQLLQNGYLELDTPISNYLPDLPKHIANIVTVRSLIMYTSGYELDDIKGFRDQLKETTNMQEVYKLHLEYLPKWEKYKTFAPNGKFDYSNDSYDLLAIIIERLTGLMYQEFITKYIFEVAGMASTSFDTTNVAIPYRYDLNTKGLKDYTSYYPNSIGRVSGAGGLKSTVEDLGKLFNTLYYSDALLDLSQKNLMFALLQQSNTASNPDIGRSPIEHLNIEFNKTASVKNGRSMGFSISYDTNLTYGHNGTNIGNSAELRFFPHSGYLMIVLCNNRSGAHNFFRFFNNHLPKN